MSRFALSSARRPRAIALVAVAVLAVALVVTGVVLTTSGGSQDQRPASQPGGAPSAAPAELEPSDAPAPPDAERPNIVVVMADDMRTDEIRFMPQMRRLFAEEGLSFRNSFSPFPLCCPARASFLTGQYAHNHEVFSHVEPYGFGSFDDRRSLATSLNASGYNTTFLGKYLNGYGVQKSKVTGKGSFRYVPAGWTDWYGAPSRPPNSGFDGGGTYNYWNTLFNVNGKIDASHKGQYQTNVLGRMSRRLVERYHRSAKPFFMYLNPVAPHFGAPREKDDPDVRAADGSRVRFKTPARPKKVRGIFDDEIPQGTGMPQDGGPSEADIRDKPAPMGDLPELDAQRREAVRTLSRQRAESLYVLDGQVKRLVDTLKSTGEWDNTVLMFTSDNGYFLGEHRMPQGKIKGHEPSLRVPLLMAGKGIPQGARFDPVTTMDVTATITDLARAKPPFRADGASVLDTIEADQGWVAPVLTEGLETSSTFRDGASDPAEGFDDARSSIGVRTGRWKYLRYNTGEAEMYDLDADPNELRNVFDAPRYAAAQQRLEQVWLAYKDCRGASCRQPMAPALRRDVELNRARTDQQSAGVQRRYGYFR